MSAECHECGLDIVYPEGTWPIGECPVCAPRYRLITFVESVRGLGRGAIQSYESPTLSDDDEAAMLDIFDRQMDHIVGFVIGRQTA